MLYLFCLAVSLSAVLAQGALLAIPAASALQWHDTYRMCVQPTCILWILIVFCVGGSKAPPVLYIFIKEHIMVYDSHNIQGEALSKWSAHA